MSSILDILAVGAHYDRMNLNQVGANIKKLRLASGLSQSELAVLSSISRATLNYLESGKLSELGSSKLFHLMDVLGVHPNLFPEDLNADEANIIAKAVKSSNVSYRKGLTTNMLEDALSSGKIPHGFEGNMLYFIDEFPEPMVIETIRAVAAKKNIRPRKVWLNTLSLAKQVQSPRKLWNVHA